jgi:hypothetical protein
MFRACQNARSSREAKMHKAFKQVNVTCDVLAHLRLERDLNPELAENRLILASLATINGSEVDTDSVYSDTADRIDDSDLEDHSFFKFGDKNCCSGSYEASCDENERIGLRPRRRRAGVVRLHTTEACTPHNHASESSMSKFKLLSTASMASSRLAPIGGARLTRGPLHKKPWTIKAPRSPGIAEHASNFRLRHGLIPPLSSPVIIHSSMPSTPTQSSRVGFPLSHSLPRASAFLF